MYFAGEKVHAAQRTFFVGAICIFFNICDSVRRGLRVARTRACARDNTTYTDTTTEDIISIATSITITITTNTTSFWCVLDNITNGDGFLL